MAKKATLELVRRVIFGGAADSLADMLDEKDSKIETLENEIEEQTDKIVDLEVDLKAIVETAEDVVRGIRSYDELKEKIDDANARFKATSTGSAEPARQR